VRLTHDRYSPAGAVFKHDTGTNMQSSPTKTTNSAQSNSLNERVSIYQPEQEGLIFPQLPEFDSVEQERQHRQQRLVAGCRAFAMHNFDYGMAGHISVRDPEHPNLYWTNPMAVHFSQVKVSNLILADHEGRVVEGQHAINRAGFVVHASVHEAHPEIIAMCHAHTPHGTAWCSTGRHIEPFNQDAACFYDNHAVVSDDGGAVTVFTDQGEGVVQAFANNRAVLHQNHGILTASRHSVDDAVFWFIAMDRCCQVQMLIESGSRKPPLMEDEAARHSATHVGSDYLGWLHFQPVYDQVLAANPDMFD